MSPPDARNEVDADEMFFLEEFGLAHQSQNAYPFSYVDFVKEGKDNSAAKDDYLHKDYYDSWMHTRTGSLGFWYSENPYGPWHEFYYTDYWTVDDLRNLTYQPKLSPKWISEDGKERVLIWSDAMKNRDGRSHTVNYKWNHMKITLQAR